MMVTHEESSHVPSVLHSNYQQCLNDIRCQTYLNYQQLTVSYIISLFLFFGLKMLVIMLKILA